MVRPIITVRPTSLSAELHLVSRAYKSQIRDAMVKQISRKWISPKLIVLVTALWLCVLIGRAGFAHDNFDHLDQLPDLGSQAANFLSERDAATLGAAFIRQSRFQLPYIYDPELVNYINELGQELLAHSADADKPYQFYLQLPV